MGGLEEGEGGKIASDIHPPLLRSTRTLPHTPTTHTHTALYPLCTHSMLRPQSGLAAILSCGVKNVSPLRPPTWKNARPSVEMVSPIMRHSVALKDIDIALASGNCVAHFSPHPRAMPWRASFHHETGRATSGVPSAGHVPLMLWLWISMDCEAKERNEKARE